MKDVTLNKVAICSNKKFREMIINYSHINDADKTIAVAYWETPALYYDIKRRYPEKDVYYIEVENNNNLYGFIENAIYVKSEEEFPNMHFDKVIMNPPYDGNSNMYMKCTKIATDHADKVICLSPVINYFSSTKKSVIELRNNLSSKFIGAEKVNSNGFDVALDKDLYILKFGKTDKPSDFSEFRFDKCFNKDLAKSIFSKLCNYNNLYDKICMPSDFSKNNYNCYFIGIRGNRDQKTGKLCADWTTLFNPSIKYEFEEYKGNSKDVMSFGFDTKNECINFVNYCDSDIIMFAIWLSKVSFNTDKVIFKNVPCMPTYTKAWTDDKIAKELGLTGEEVAYIHEEMKGFGYKAMKKEN